MRSQHLCSVLGYHKPKQNAKRYRGSNQAGVSTPEVLTYKDASSKSVLSSSYHVLQRLWNTTSWTKDLQKVEKKNLQEKSWELTHERIRHCYRTVLYDWSKTVYSFKTSHRSISTVVCLSKGAYIQINKINQPPKAGCKFN